MAKMLHSHREPAASSGTSGWDSTTPVYSFGGAVEAAPDDATITTATHTLDMTGSPIKWRTIDASTTITLANASPRRRVELRIIQGATGGTAAWSGVTRWKPGGAAPALATTAGHLDVVLLTVEADGTVTGEHLGAAS